VARIESRRSARLLPVALLFLVGALCTPVAHASQPLGDLDIRNLTLAVNAKGEALLSYDRSDGRPRHVLLWGAINALPPSPEVAQVRFKTDYAGGWGKYRDAGYWKTFRNVCKPYQGPVLAFGVTACTAPDGSHWAVQSWQRLLPLRGFAPFRPQQGAFGFNVSHWSGPLAELTVSQNWTYGGSWTGLFGRLTYSGAPVHGFRTPARAKRADGYARYVYIDTFNSAYGPGWRRDAAKVLHLRNGAFCYSFVPQTPPPGYPDSAPRGPAPGELERVTVMGPGVTPDVQWQGPGLLGTYDATQDEDFNRLFDQLVGPDDQVCRNER
jgi:hypothetical protein